MLYFWRGDRISEERRKKKEERRKKKEERRKKKENRI
jgi:hypothetical protein